LLTDDYIENLGLDIEIETEELGEATFKRNELINIMTTKCLTLFNLAVEYEHLG
jgi:hypothetical protein